MKRLYLLITIIFSLFLLVSCVNIDKTFKSLDINYIPNRVTKDFILDKGDDNKFLWTSNNDEVIKIENNYATVIQQDEDILVVVTASVNLKTKDFEIVVLKKGSGLSPFEKSLEFMSLYNEINVDQDGLYIPKRVEELFLTFDDNLIGNNAIPTYIDFLEGILIEYLETDYRELNIYFNEMIDGELVQIHSNKIKINYQEYEDLFFHLRPYSNYLNNDLEYLIITNNEQLDTYIKTLDDLLENDLYLIYLNEIRDSNYYFNYKSIILLNIFQPTSDNEVVPKNIKLQTNNIIIDIDTHYGTAREIKYWQFVIEVNKDLSNIENIIINTNYVDEQEELYLKCFSYSYNYLSDLNYGIIIIESLSDLEDYMIVLDELELDYGLSHIRNFYKNHLLKYNEQYFISKKLILINHIYESGSIHYLYSHFELNNNKLDIYLKSNNPFILTTDENPWNFIFEADKLLKFDEVGIKFKRNETRLNPIIKKTLKTIIFSDDSYNINNVYKPVGNLLDYQELLEDKYNIDFSSDVIIIEEKEAFKEIYSILKGEDYNREENLEDYIWLLVKRVAPGSQFISIEYSIYDQYIGYRHPNGKEYGDAAIFNTLDIIQILLDDYNDLYNLNFINKDD